jgi:hypothetical protein
MKRIACVLAWIVATGCFSVNHRLPENAYFGTLPGRQPAAGAPFQTESMKNWALAGLLPYSRWTTSDVVARQLGASATQPLQIRAIETVFTPLDVLISIVPGAFYGYYVWAPRTIRVSGSAAGSAGTAK